MDSIEQSSFPFGTLPSSRKAAHRSLLHNKFRWFPASRRRKRCGLASWAICA